jgi:hypothetical protein
VDSLALGIAESSGKMVSLDSLESLVVASGSTGSAMAAGFCCLFGLQLVYIWIWRYCLVYYIGFDTIFHVMITLYRLCHGVWFIDGCYSIYILYIYIDIFKWHGKLLYTYHKGNQGFLIWHCEGHLCFWYNAIKAIYCVFGLNILNVNMIFWVKKSKTLGRHILFLNIFVKKNNCFTFFMNYFYFSQKRKINIYISQL